MVSGGVKATRAGEQETGGGKQAAESCYRGGKKTQSCPGETTQGGQQQRQQLKLRLNSSANQVNLIASLVYFDQLNDEE